MNWCPRCASEEIEVLGTYSSDDGERHSSYHCKNCSFDFDDEYED